MASLINCQNVVSYTSQEAIGDSPTGVGGAQGAFEAQGVPEGITLDYTGDPINATEANWFYLIIKPLPGYHVSRDMITIESINIVEENITFTPSSDDITINYNNYPNGTAGYDILNTTDASGVSGDTTGMINVILYDKEQVASPSCNNWVIAQVMMQPWFNMPASNYTIKIDFGGTAINCTAGEENLAYNTIETKLIVSNIDGPNEVGGAYLFVAQYYDDESYASSNFNLQNTPEYINEDFESIDFCYHPVYDWNGGFLNGIDNPFYTMSFVGGAIENNCWNNYQPTCYTSYNNMANNLIPAGLGSATSADNYFPSICGQLLFPDTYLLPPSAFATFSNGFFGDCQDFSECGQAYTAIAQYCEEASRARYDFKIETYENSTRYLSQFDYPTIEPGGPMIPSSLCWYLSIGNGSDFELDSDISIDVWKIITVVGENTNAIDTNMFDVAGLYDGTTTCSLDTTPITTNTNEMQVCESYLVSDSTENNSDLDFENKTITQIDSKTVKLTIPFKSNLSIPRFTPADLTDIFTANMVKRTNKIFLNIYPIE